jgi:hypothetical protein
MLSPIGFDLLCVLLPLLIAGGAFLAGKLVCRLSYPWRWAVLLPVCGVVLLLVVAYFTPIRHWTNATLYRIGGETTVACVAAMLLLGVVWSQPGRSTSSAFLGALVGLIGVILLIHHSGRLTWRWLGGAAWHNRADAKGCVTQSTGWSCSPAAAVMLLHHHGINATEGEMAYRAGTNLLLGTNVYEMAVALSEKVKTMGLSVDVHREDYNRWQRRGVPFLAHVTIQNLGGHALFIERLTDEAAEVIDPRHGQRQTIPRAALERIWDGTGICLTHDSADGASHSGERFYAQVCHHGRAGLRQGDAGKDAQGRL